MSTLNDFANWLAGWPNLIGDLLFWIGLPTSGPGAIWSIVQLAVIVLAYSSAFIASRLLTPTIEARIRAAQLRPGLLRLSAIVLRRLHNISFAVALWIALVTMRTVTWSSRSYFLSIIAGLVTAWVVISISSRVIRNRSISRVIELGGWILVTLSILGILPQAMALLDSLAITINQLRVSALTVIQGIVVLTVLIWGAALISKFAERQLSGLEDFTPSMRVLIGKIIRFSLIVLATLMGLYAIGVDFTALTLLSGAVGVGLGFGLQKVVSNLVSGIILLLDKSIKPGDVITVGDTFGWITSLNARYASITMRDGRQILIPNEDLITQQVQNWSFEDPYVRLDIEFGVSFESDPHQVRELARQAALSQDRVLKDNARYPVVCHITAFGESSIDFVLRFYIGDPKNGLTNIRGNVFLALWDTFKQHNISIPYPHREILVREPQDTTPERRPKRRSKPLA